ncbi:hypothetical protein C7999DRAFT_13945 [Corynascus novoguineensis]|uniref:Uncharacterized protein n=1 Tax=Corynascus novoguineensis TaxID=1126955 RepID=A0AAN7CTJ1_9PEZI|nr:hypothetical protein C7999DRAFT_13945 [Corynascus novoguineensis]
MRPATALLPLLTAAAAGVGVTSGVPATSKTAAVSCLSSRSSFLYRKLLTRFPKPDLASRNSDAAALAAQLQVKREQHFTTVAVSEGGDASTADRPAPTDNSDDDNNDVVDDDDDDDNDNDNDNDNNKSNSQENDNEDANNAEQNKEEENPQPSETPSIAADESSNIISVPTDTDTTTTSKNPPVHNDEDGQEKQGTGLSAGTAAGIAAGAVACVAILAAAAFLLWRRRQGGIRGAVITADYPQGLENMESQEPKLPHAPPPALEGGSGNGYRGTAGKYYPPPWVEEQDLGEGAGRNGRGSNQGGFIIPPAGTMPGDPRFEVRAEYPLQQHQYRQPSWLGGDLGEARPVSALTTCPSPGPALPVSPMTPYRPDSSIFLTAGQRPPSSHPRVSSYYPGRTNSDLPTFLIPGGNRARAMSFSSVAYVGERPRVPELVGSPLPSVPSMIVVVEGQSPTRRSHTG